VDPSEVGKKRTREGIDDYFGVNKKTTAVVSDPNAYLYWSQNPQLYYQYYYGYGVDPTQQMGTTMPTMPSWTDPYGTATITEQKPEDNPVPESQWIDKTKPISAAYLQHYKASGVLPIAKDKDGVPYAMLLCEFRGENHDTPVWLDFGGKRASYETQPAATALRELNQPLANPQPGSLMQPQSVLNLRYDTVSACPTRFWFKTTKYILFFAENYIEYQPEIVTHYKEEQDKINRKSLIAWIKVSDLVKGIQSTTWDNNGNPEKLSRSFCEMLGNPMIQSYFEELIDPKDKTENSRE